MPPTGSSWRGRARLSLHPVFFGSALTGAGIDVAEGGHRRAAARSRRRSSRARSRPASSRSSATRKVGGSRTCACSRAPCGCATGLPEGKVTAIHVFADGAVVRRDRVVAGEIAKLRGLAEIRIGDPIGEPPAAPEHHFAPPTLETVVVPVGDDRRCPPSSRARPARRAGPVDRRPPGRARGALGLALRRGAERGDPGDSRERLRPRRHVPRDDRDLRGAARRHRRGGRGPARRVEPVRGDDRPPRSSRRPSARASSSERTSIPARCRCTSTRRSRRSARAWPGTSGTPCARVSPAGRSPTAS